MCAKVGRRGKGVNPAGRRRLSGAIPSHPLNYSIGYIPASCAIESYYLIYSVYSDYISLRPVFAAPLEAVGHSRLKPVVDSAVPLDDAASAAAGMEQGAPFGKIVLHITL